MRDQMLEDLRELIEYRVREGFDSVHEVVESASNWAREKHGRSDLMPTIKRLMAQALTEQQAEQVGWGPTTDCDRRDAAFAALNAQGIIARHDFSCCNNCGFTEIWDEVEQAEKEQRVDGYVFYHFQCIEQAIATGRLLMAFGCVEDDPQAFKRVGETIVAELQRVGLNASWGGTAGHPIVADGFLWRRRRS